MSMPPFQGRSRGESWPKKILIVDDEPSIIVALQFLMEQNGYETLVAFSGEEAMEAVASHRPDLILLDIMLPVVDGFEVCQRVRENPDWKDIRIVLVSALGSEANVTKGLDLGADAYVTKPFSNARPHRARSKSCWNAAGDEEPLLLAVCPGLHAVFRRRCGQLRRYSVACSCRAAEQEFILAHRATAASASFGARRSSCVTGVGFAIDWIYPVVHPSDRSHGRGDRHHSLGQSRPPHPAPRQRGGRAPDRRHQPSGRPASRTSTARCRNASR